MKHFEAADGSGRSTIVVSANSCWNIVNFRGGLLRALRENGFAVVVAAPRDAHTSKLVELGASFVEVPMDSAGVSATRDLAVLWRYFRALRRLKPVAYLGFTAKPNIYGSLAARAVGAKVINNISGLGTVFIKHSVLTTLVARLYRASLRTSSTVFFQNRDDRDLFVGRRLVRREQTELLPGSGVDLDYFRPAQEGRRPGTFRFLLVGRLLWDKGVGEYVDAARRVRESRPGVIFQMLGPVGAINRTAVPERDLERWVADGIIDYLGESNDVRGAIGQADSIVLPSYREGLPRSLLEGSAMAKPLIATNVPGCRDVVVDGETGYLCEVRSAQSLAQAMLKLLDLPVAERMRMGAAGRRKVEREYSETIVISKYLAAIIAE